MPNDTVCVFDLDETVLSINTFPEWTLYIIFGHFPATGILQRIRVSLISIMVILARKAKVISHQTLRKTLQRQWHVLMRYRANRSLKEGFVKSLAEYVRPELYYSLSWAKQGRIKAILATSAAGEYAYSLGKALGFTHIIATSPYSSKKMHENSGEHKSNAVGRCLASLKWPVKNVVVFTDSLVDLPLIRMSKTTYWFGDKKEITQIHACLPGVILHNAFDYEDCSNHDSISNTVQNCDGLDILSVSFTLSAHAARHSLRNCDD